MVKADAYGHGLRQIAALLMQSGTDVFGVANLDEARDIRAVGRGWPILMLGACLPGETDRAIKDNVMPTLSSLEEARRFSKAAKKLNNGPRPNQSRYRVGWIRRFRNGCPTTGPLQQASASRDHWPLHPLRFSRR